MLAEGTRRSLHPLDRQPPRWEIAGQVGIHPVYLAGAFRKHQQCTIGDYVRRLRIDFARDRIAGSDASLIEIAAAAGFADQSHFTRCFKRLAGTTPGAKPGRRLTAG